MDKKKMNKRTLIIIGIIIIASPFFLLFLVFGTTELKIRRTEVRDVTLVTSYGLERTYVKMKSPNERVLPYYNSIEISLREFYRSERNSTDDNNNPPTSFFEMLSLIYYSFHMFLIYILIFII